MDNGYVRRHRREHHPNSRPTLAVNARYTASLEANAILIRNLTDDPNRIHALRLIISAKWSHHDPVLAFHPIRPNLLAASNGSQLVIYDVEASTTKHVFNGNGRTITSISFDQQDDDTLATGSADGTICIWSMKETSRPTRRLRAFQSACNHVSFHHGQMGLVAAIAGNRLGVWRLSNARPIICFRVKLASLYLFTWCPQATARILTLSFGGVLSLYDLGTTVRGSPPRKGQSRIHDSDEEDETHSMSNDVDHAPSHITFNLACSVVQAEVLGRNGLVTLPGSCKDLYFYSYNLDQGTLTELWRLHKETNICSFTLRRNLSAVDVVIVLQSSNETYRVPAPVLDSMGWSSDLQSASVQLGDDKASKRGTETATHGSMRPQKKQRRLDRHLEPARPGPRLKSVKDSPAKARSRYNKGDQVSRPGTSTTQSMTSSLELPQERHTEDDQDSPMPFLSPNIPARRVSPGLVTPMDESMQLPPLALYDPIAPTVDHAHESDSDDETFAGDMKGSGTLLPGGINVPLPRSCGALFGPNGQLITFFPYSIKKAVHENFSRSKGSTGVEKHGEEVNKLFPSFGNLLSTSQSRDSPSDSNRASSEDLQNGSTPGLAIHSSSLDDGPSWTVKSSPVKSKMHPLPGEHRVNVSIRNLETLTPTRQTLADTYELTNDEGRSFSDVCRENATLATKAGLKTTAGAWHLLAIILDSSGVDTQVAHGLADISAVLLGKRPAMSRNTSMASSHDGFTVDPTSEIFSLLQLPFGRTWALERLFKWAEDRVDVQLLACMSTLLERTRDTLAASARSSRRRRHAASIRSSLPLLSGLDRDLTNFPPVLPSFQTDDTAVTTAGNSPNKGYRSRLSSGNPSQPTTPYLESSSSTPPFPFPNVIRQQSKLTSGSASPEHQRSSFGAAAKNYAASIAEKFGSYGSSPPSKRFGTSPGNELSSSLPNTTGSWSKSVSFASTMETAKTSHRSLSLAQEDDNYDSDRTVDDNSVLNTPKKPHGGVSVTKKKGGFYEEASAKTPSQPIPAQVAVKCGFWREHYAEQLRSWDRLTGAAEMTDFPSSKNPKSSMDDVKDAQHVLPETASGRRFNDCSICFCVLQAAQQVCPACLHVTHPGCLEELLIHVGADDFTCPTGCGCDCVVAIEVPFVADETAVMEEEVEHKQPFKKRHNSLTDPLRLRQRLQGDSW